MLRKHGSGLLKRLPNSEQVWVITKEVGAVEDWPANNDLLVSYNIALPKSAVVCKGPVFVISPQFGGQNMPEIRIYEIKRQHLGELLCEADNPAGATLLIPNLQRPFVWTPAQVTLLIDSLLRGWPFATLLLWEINTNRSGESIPARQFWRIEDRTSKEVPIPVRQANPPARYRMVLDGQQRLQSLILAVGGDNYGFRLTDADWFDLTDQGARRTKATREAWSLGELCLDLPVCIEAFEKADESIAGIEFRNVLQWVVRDPNAGLSQPRPGRGYKAPLQAAWDAEGRFLSFGRLWNLPHPDLIGEPKAR